MKYASASRYVIWATLIVLVWEIASGKFSNVGQKVTGQKETGQQETRQKETGQKVLHLG